MNKNISIPALKGRAIEVTCLYFVSLFVKKIDSFRFLNCQSFEFNWVSELRGLVICTGILYYPGLQAGDKKQKCFRALAQ